MIPFSLFSLLLLLLDLLELFIVTCFRDDMEAWQVLL
jgi:hypothetical protein